MKKIKLNDGTEIAVNNFRVSTNVSNNTGNMNFDTSFSNHAIVHKKLTPENMSEITLITEKENVVYSGFNNNIIITENVSEFNENISISASK